MIAAHKSPINKVGDAVNGPTLYRQWLAALQRLPAMARIGWVLYGTSMLTPGYQFHGIGVQMWLLVPRTALHMLRADGSAGLVVGAALLIAVASNVTVFVRVPRWLKVSAIVAPWLPFAVLLIEGQRIGIGRFFSIPCFFPWAIGVAMINFAGLRHDRSS